MSMVYKIRDRRDGTYIGAGGYHSKHGKAWATIGHLKAAITHAGLQRLGCWSYLELVILEETGTAPLESIYD